MICRPRRSTFAFVLQVCQRDDRAEVLNGMHIDFGGSLTADRGRGEDSNEKPRVLGLIKYFDKYPPILKAAEYSVWRSAAMLYYENSVGARNGSVNPEWLVGEMEAAKDELSRLKKYVLQGDNNALDGGHRVVGCSSRHLCKFAPSLLDMENAKQ